MPSYWIVWLFFSSAIAAKRAQWEWMCINGDCVKQRITSDTKIPYTSLQACQLLCRSDGSLWPKPTGELTMSNNLVTVDPNKLEVSIAPGMRTLNNLIPAGIKIFTKQIKSYSGPSKGKKLHVVVNIKDHEVNRITLGVDESYGLEVSQAKNDFINATITANNYFGGRHGLETLGQLVVYDELYDELRMPSEVLITDKPVYTYRGVLIDTPRNYLSTNAIKRTIDGMAASKLNTLHWHLTDSSSFPHVFPSHPELSDIGAYSPKKVYTPEDVNEIVRYGQERGVRVLPELDAPAHVGEGWQDTGFLVCFNKQPWYGNCPSPPCGQIDPTKDGLYDLLQDLYGDIIKQFNPDIFHMGGDEVSFLCWNSTHNIQKWMHDQGWGTTESDFMKLWNMFQSRALQRFDKQTSEKLPIVVWTSELTNKKYVEKYLPKDRYIIQVWTEGDDPQIMDLLKLGYKLILSNYDALYLDCGVSSCFYGGPNWCSPYKGWQQIYENSPARMGGVYKDQFIGAEATMWGAQVDDTSIDSWIWPRAAALAERLWGEPQTIWTEAEQRMLIHRERLVQRGINADSLAPQWCMQNEQNCPIMKSRPSQSINKRPAKTFS